MSNISFIKKINLALKYKGTSLNVIYDKINKNKLKKFPRLITIFITNKCNLCCPMCFNSELRNKNIKSEDISLEIIKKILPELKKYKPMVYITGGEPLLSKDIFKIIKLLSDSKIFTSMTSNGFLLKNNVNNILNSGLEFISLSLDHYEEEKHDLSRGVKGSYKALIDGLDILLKNRRKTPSNIKINTVVNKDNYYCLSEMYDFIETLNIEEWSIQHHSFKSKKIAEIIGEWNLKNKFGWNSYGEIIKDDFYLDLPKINILKRELKKIYNKSKKFKTKLSITPQIDELESYYLGKFPSKQSSCKSPINSMNISDNCKLSLCLGMVIKIGDLNKNPSIISGWNSKKSRDFQKLISKERVLLPCYRCCSLKYCFKS